MGKESILVVDDDPALRTVLVGLLSQAGYAARAVASGAAALEEVTTQQTDLVVTDLRMPGMDGMALLAELGRVAPEVPTIMISAHGTIPVAVEAMKAGAKEFVMKPFDRDEVLVTIDRVLDAYVRRASEPPEPPAARAMIGDSATLAESKDLIARAAKSTANVLLRGESGTGKEVAARAIHAQSARASGSFVPVHCAALPDTLLESELFGYEKGAFTGAVKRKPGRVELAAGGTLLLDEIGDVSPQVQVKLLRLMQDKEFQRVGGAHPERVDVRFVAATHRDLETMVQRGEFREDLFYRLNVIPIWLPALRERREDIPALARRFCAAASEANGRSASLAPGAVALLEQQAWPGNVRELQTFVERLVVFSDGATIGEADVQRELGRARRGAPAGQSSSSHGSLQATRGVAERQAVEEALARARGNRSLAARLLGISRRTLYNKMGELDLK